MPNPGATHPPPLPDAAMDATYDPEAGRARIRARHWRAEMERDGYTELRVYLTGSADDLTSYVTITSVGIDDSVGYVVSAHQALDTALRRMTPTWVDVPTPDDVRAALEWCRAALRGAS